MNDDENVFRGPGGNRNDNFLNESRTSDAGWNQNTSPDIGNGSFSRALPSENTGDWSFPAPVYRPPDLGGLHEGVEGSGQSVVENMASGGGALSQAGPLSVQPTKSVGFALPGEPVPQPGSGERLVDEILENMIRGGPPPGRIQNNVTPAPLLTGTVPRDQLTDDGLPTLPPGSLFLCDQCTFTSSTIGGLRTHGRDIHGRPPTPQNQSTQLLPPKHPGRPGGLLGRNDSLSQIVRTMSTVTSTTTSSTLSSETTPFPAI